MLACENVFPHFEQLNGLSTVWISSWVFRLLACENVLLHFEQLNGLSTVWIFSWVFRWLACANVLPHFEQLNGLSTSVDCFMGLHIAYMRKFLATLWKAE